MSRLLAALGICAVASSVAFAAEVKPPSDQNSASTPVDPKQVVCRPVDANGETMLPGAKVCHTLAEWADIDRQNGQTSSPSSSNGH